MISAIIPTITGREASLAAVIASYEETLAGTKHEILIEHDHSSWPAACNAGYLRSSGDVVHFGADDLAPLPGWHKAALAHLSKHDELPAARVFNYSAGGEFDNIADGPDGSIVHFTRVPILRRDQYERIGPWPPLAYYADVWVSESARKLGIETRILFGYSFVHSWSQIGRTDSDRTLGRAWKSLQRLLEAPMSPCGCGRRSASRPRRAELRREEGMPVRGQSLPRRKVAGEWVEVDDDGNVISEEDKAAKNGVVAKKVVEKNGAAPVDLTKLSRAELNLHARSVGLEPREYKNRALLLKALGA